MNTFLYNKRWIVCALALFTWTTGALSDGILVPPRGIDIAVKYHHVRVEIKNQAATTEIDQVFFNDSDMDSIEAVYIFPIPEGAVMTDFSMFVDGEELIAEVLDADSARVYYERIVRQRIDPALLEYMDRGLYRARVYPIRARGEKRIKLSYSEVLDYDNGICRYLYPLNTEKFSSAPLDSVSITVEISSTDPIKTVYSPSHEIAVQQEDDHFSRAVYAEGAVIPDRDFLLYYTVSTENIGIHLMSYRGPEEDGFYLLLAAPKREIETTEVIGKRLLFVIDRSGSMAGTKLYQAKEALKFCVNNLNQGDVFNIIDFSTDVMTFRSEPVSIDGTSRTDALNYIDRITSLGGTNINDALLTALRQTKNDTMTNMIVFLTDGLPTVGVTLSDHIAENVLAENRFGARLFVFGVGYDVNTHLLDVLSDENHGYSTYVGPDEDIETAVSSFYLKVSYPVLANLTLDFGPVPVYDEFPVDLPDLFLGSQLVRLGRYSSSGTTTIVLTGIAGEKLERFEAEGIFTADDVSLNYIPRLWATRKVGFLLDQIRLHGENEELKNEVIYWAKRFGIITPYTSFLILEDTMPPGTFDFLYDETGERAFDDAIGIGNWKSADNTSDILSDGIKYVQGKTFFLRDSTWIDSRYDSLVVPVTITFGSDEYFKTLAENPGLGKYFALGRNVIVCTPEYTYWVRAISSLTPEEPQAESPNDFRLYQNHPNPFNAGTMIRFYMPRTAAVRLAIYNLRGQHVRDLYDGVKWTGYHALFWDGRDFSGKMVASGIYFCEMKTEAYVDIKTMLLMR